MSEGNGQYDTGRYVDRENGIIRIKLDEPYKFRLKGSSEVHIVEVFDVLRNKIDPPADYFGGDRIAIPHNFIRKIVGRKYGKNANSQKEATDLGMFLREPQSKGGKTISDDEAARILLEDFKEDLDEEPED